MKEKRIDLSWLPPSEEWDFRSVTVAECRVACHWEYARETRKIESVAIGILAKGAAQRAALGARSEAARLFCPVNYRQPARELFPRAWTTLTKEERTAVLGSFYPIPTMTVHKLGNFFRRMQWAEGASSEVLQPYLEHAYVVQPNFALHGVEAVIKELEAWARREAKNYRQAPRAKAAEPPFDALKWLAVRRLDQARCEAHVTFEKTQEALAEYRRQHPQRAHNDVFPIYASHGAWSKAKADAARCRSKAMNEPSFLLAGLA
jgi:hypothetical protein